jgi:hypothetical protein
MVTPGCHRLGACLLVSAWMLCSGSVWADDDGGLPLFRTVGSAPAGFEALTRAQTALVDVYYGDMPLVSVMASFTPETIRFENLDEVIEQIPDLIEVQAVRAALDGELNTHAQLACRDSRRDCGYLDTSVAGVIFNEETFRVDLFVASRFRTAAVSPRRKFLPSSESGFSFVENLAGNFAGSDAGSDGITVTSFTTLAHRENRLVAIASYSDADDVTIDRLFAQRDFEGRQYVGGLFRTSGRAPAFTGENDLLGIRVASSLDTRNDLPQSRGTPIDVFLASRARVDIIKDGRLISTRFYDPGNQMLDTAMLPEGAYEITIRVTENGQVTEETRFFTKTSRVPPRDQPLFTLEVGEVMLRTTRDLFPEDAGAFLVRAGYSRRLTDIFGFDAGMAGTREDQLLEAGLFQIDTLPGTRNGYYELQASTFASVAGDLGFAFNGMLRYGRYNLSFDFRQVSKDEPVHPESEPSYRLVPDDLTQASVSLQMPLRAGNLGIGLSSNRRGAEGTRTSQSINFRYPLMNTRSGFLEFRSDLSRTDGEVAAFVGVRFNFWRNSWSGSVAPGYQHADQNLGLDDGMRVDGTAAWHDPESRFGDLRVSTNASLGATNRLGSSVDWQHFLGRTMAALERTDRSGRTTTNYTASFSTSMLTDGESWTFGGQNTNTSAVVIDLEGRAPDTDFEVLVDGYRRGYAPAGRSTAIHLPPYRTYDVRIAPRRANFVSYKDRVEQVTLYPGNVRRLTWEIADLLVVVGRVRDQFGEPLADAQVEGSHGMASTDTEGYFQAELPRPSGANGVLLEFRDQLGLCRALVPEFDVRAGVAFLNTVTCRRIEAAVDPG